MAPAPAPAPAPTPGALGATVAGAAGGRQARRPQPMVASKPAADDLITGSDPDLRRAGKPAVAESPPALARNPYAGVGRNEPCPCGSGKKFKKCHGAGL